MTKLICGLVILLTGFASYAVHASIDLNIPQQLPPEFANANKTLDNAKALFRDKCIKVAGEENGDEAFNNIAAGVGSLGECLTTILNFTAIQTEIEQYGPRGELDVVFAKYCDKQPDVLKCIDDFNTKLLPCLENDEREHKEVLMHILRSLLDFVCFKGGDRIALFIAEKGPECLDSKKEDIQECFKNTFSHYMPAEGVDNLKSLPKFVIGDEQCNDLEKLKNCIVEKLETCSEVTPANIVESLFRFIKKETICRNKPNSKRK